MRAVAGEPALEVAVGALGELGRELLDVVGARARPVRELGRRPRGRAPPRASANRSLSASTTSARSRISARPWRASAASHAGSEPRSARPARTRADQRVALRERRGVLAARAGAGGPQRGDDLVEVRAPQRRRAQDQLQPVGQEDGDERPRRRVGQPLDGRAVDAQALRLARLEADVTRVAPSLVLASQLEPRQRCAPKRTTSRSFAVRHERPVQAKYSASSRFVLPAPLRPVMTVSPGPGRSSAAS